MDNSQKRLEQVAELDGYLLNKDCYQLQKALYKHMDKLKTPWIWDWLSEKLNTVEEWHNIILLYFNIRWCKKYSKHRELTQQEIFSFFKSITIFAIRCFQDTYVCRQKNKPQAIDNYNFLVHTKINKWAAILFNKYGDNRAADIEYQRTEAELKFGILKSPAQQDISPQTFTTIPQNPAILCSLERTNGFLRSFGYYRNTIYFCNPNNKLVADIDNGNDEIRQLRREATIQFLFYIKWINFSQTNQNISNNEKWSLIFSKTFEDINYNNEIYEHWDIVIQ